MRGSPGSIEEVVQDLRTGVTELRPGQGCTAELWSLLSTLAAADLGVARAVEPHLDALAILDQAGPGTLPDGLLDDDRPGDNWPGDNWPGDNRPGDKPDRSAWGVFAAEGPAATLAATPISTATAERAPGGVGRRRAGWRLDGDKPWCSLGTLLDAALITAMLPENGASGLFAVDLRGPGVRPMEGEWVSRGLQEIRSTGLRFDDVPAVRVGPPGWYLERPGFWWGGIGVAACWYGGAVGIAGRVFASAIRRPDDPLVALHLGRIDERLFAARACLDRASELVDASGTRTHGGRDPESDAERAAGRRLARRTRAVVARAAEEILEIAAHALGPGPLVAEPEHAKREADLRIYLRQQHAERDSLALGRDLIRGGEAPW
jgi:alkylation response protein AidB-like acyl-CoA dehydrogenase